MKHLDNLHKSFAQVCCPHVNVSNKKIHLQAIVIVLVFIASSLLFEAHLGTLFYLGAAVVMGALVGYNTVAE